jgi:GH25 family lysozyme M1 (1,4-beta-N-acetylmuramidase)
VTAVRGPDVSSYQGRPDWQRVKRAGFLFAACKATEGLTYNDPTFARNWAGIKNAGLVRIAYHFAHADRGRSPIAEARHFLDVVRDRGGTADGIPALDIEAGNLSGQNFRAWVNAWCAEIQKHWRAGLIYTGAGSGTRMVAVIRRRTGSFGSAVTRRARRGSTASGRGRSGSSPTVVMALSLIRCRGSASATYRSSTAPLLL